MRVGQVLHVRLDWTEPSGRRHRKSGMARVSRIYDDCAVFFRFRQGDDWGPLEGYRYEEILEATAS